MQDGGQTAEQWIARAEALLRDRYDCIRRASAQTLAPTIEIAPQLDAEEAEYFVRGIEQGVFSIDEEGYAQSAVLPKPSRKGKQKRALQLFWHRDGRRYLFREGVCQLSTMSALNLRYGWPLVQMQMEPTFAEHPQLAWAVDILLKGADGNVVACCEIKRNDREFEQLVAGFRHCCTAGPHRKDECEFAKNHPKYELCAAIRPAYFMAVSPGRETCFRLSYCEGTIAITAESSGLMAMSDLAAAGSRTASRHGR